ncbi:MAG: cytochrome B [Gammaproteobacteria bacterium]|nr:cytochrome B [Gammaproteobacteria bacterium]MYE52502.1 cytochrome B [Gammaproteobacteria bacterium]
MAIDLAYIGCNAFWRGTVMQPSGTVKVWDLPLRIWHWAFAVCLAGLLYTGLSGDLSLLRWHMRLGAVMVGLLLFRLLWGLWGAIHARWRGYMPSLRQFVAHFRGGRVDDPHTAPGRVLAIGFVALAAVQAATGLFANDDIFTEGPLARTVSDALSDRLTWVHNRVFMGLIALVAVHLTAHVVYALRRDPTPLAMFTGRKRAAVEPAANHWLRAALTAALAAIAVLAGGLMP